MRAVGYIRVSTSRQAESGLGLADQRRKIDALAELNDYELLDVVEDAGQSGKTTDRPGLESLMAMVDGGKVDAILIAKLDRLTRSVADLGGILARLEKRGVALVSAADSINTTTASGRLVLNVLTSVAQWEREAIAERTRAALSQLRAEGKRAGQVPFGYDADADGNLLENVGEQAVLAIIGAGREAGDTWDAIADTVAQQGYTSRTGRRHSRQGLCKIWKLHRG